MYQFYNTLLLLCYIVYNIPAGPLHLCAVFKWRSRRYLASRADAETRKQHSTSLEVDLARASEESDRRI